MWRAFASNGLTLLVVLVFALALVIQWGKGRYTAAGPLTGPICFRVGGALRTMGGVTGALAEQGAISSAFLFRAGAEYTGRGTSKLKAGSFLIGPGASMAEITETLTGTGYSTCGTEVKLHIGVARNHIGINALDLEQNRYEEVARFDPAAGEIPRAYLEVREETGVRYRISVAEGVTSWQVVEGLKGADFLSGEIAETPPEGTLAAINEDVPDGMDRNALLARMAEVQTGVLEAAWRNRAEGLPIQTRQEALILASIVEKETGVPDERSFVASVFVNRLRQGMKLQTDPTVIYGITGGQGGLGRGLRQSELRRETPWNTYVIDGLPPTPIASPGPASIEAALNPADTEYLFFVADGSGGHAFAGTLAEHNRNVARWRRIEAERADGADE